MKRIYTILFAAIITLSFNASNIYAQCNYEVKLYDSWGDGWNGSTIDIKAGNTTTIYTLSTGSDTTINLMVSTGDSIVLNFLGGGPYDFEVSFELIDPNSVQIYSSGTSPSLGYHFDTLAFCPSCNVPGALSANLISLSSVAFSWMDSNPATEWEIEYGVSGFTQGAGNRSVVNNDTVNITGLTPQTNYDFYVRSICAPGDTSIWAGPVSLFMGYCQPAPTSVDGDGITNVTYGTINNSSLTETNNFGDYTHLAAEVFRSTTLSVDITYATGYTYDTKIWVDWNSDFDFDDAGEEVYSGTSLSTNPTTLSAGFNIPSTAPLDTLRMRIGGADSGPLDPCYSGAYGAFEDYSIVVMPTPTCIAPSLLNSFNYSPTSAEISWTENNSATEWQIQYDTAGFTLGSGTFLSAMNDTAVLSALTIGANYDYYVRAICGPGDTSAWTLGTFYLGYCSPAPSSVDNDGITNVTVGTINNSTLTEPNNYGDYSHLVTDVYISTIVNVDITYSTGYTYGTKIWVDWNNDLDFDDAGEEVYSGTSLSANPTTLSASFPVPLTATQDTLRMRIGGADSGPITPCYTGSYASIEDYSINVLQFSCSPPVNVTTFNTLGTSTDISWSAVPPSINWQIEYDTVGFSQGTGSISAVNNDTTSLTGLSPSSHYEFYVRTICAPGDTSVWAGPYSFMTPCMAVMAPFTENFDALALSSPYTALPQCWEVQSGPDYWEVTNDVTNTGHTYLPNIGDHTTGSSNYMWIDASSDITGNEMVTPLIDMSSLSVPTVGFWFASNNTTNSINHTIALDAWDGSTWVNITTQTGNFASWVEVSGLVPSFIPSITKFRIHAIANPAGTSSNYYYNDLGVDDFFVKESPVNELQLSEIIAPSPLCAGPQNVSLELVNLGGNSIDSVEIHYSLNSFIDSAIYNTSINPGDTAIVSLGMYPFLADTLYNVEIYTFNPNGTADSNPLNDTIRLSNIRTGLNGAYTIDGSLPSYGSNFNTITDFSDALASVGMCGSVVANLSPGIHHGQLNIIDNAYPVVINGNDTSLATLSHDGSIRNATVFLQNASDITIVNTTIEATGGTDSWGIQLFENVNDVLIAGNRFKMSVASTTDKALINISGSETSNTTMANNVNNINITSNSFYGGNIAISAYGGSDQSERLRNIQITGNNISMQDDYGIYAYYTDSIFIAGNIIDQLQGSTSDGIYLSDLENFIVTGNYSTGVDNALYLEDANSEYSVGSNAVISNNMLTGGDDGIYIVDMHKTNIYHNTLYAEDYGMYLNDPDSLDIRNNILFSNSSYAFYGLDSAYIMMDFNIFNTNGTGDLVRFGSTSHVYSDLAAFQAAVPSLNANSLEGDPMFVSANDLHVVGPLASDVGDNSVGITSDIDGDARPMAPSTTVDIGADEFELASCLQPLNLTVGVITSSSAELGWTENNAATSWEIEYGNSGFNQGAGTKTVVNSNPATITGLSHTTEHDFYVRSICGPGDTSVWAGPYSFMTLCGAYTAPYSQNFDNAPATSAFSGVTCWTATGPGAVDVDLVTSPDGSNIGAIPSLPNAVEFNDGIFNTDTSLLVSPQFSDLGTGMNRIRFQAAFESTNAGEGIYIGVMSDPNVASTFVPLDSIDATDIGGNFGFNEVIVNLTNTAVIGNNEYIAFAHGDGTGNFEAYIDNFVYEQIPANNIGISAIVSPNSNCGLGTADTVEVVINNYGPVAQSNFNLAYSINGVAIAPETYTGTINPFSSASYKFTTTANLSSTGNYTISAYTLLAGDTINNNDTAGKEVVSIVTVNSLPYAESFENGPGGWFVEGNNTSWELGAPSNTIIDTAADGTEAWVTDLDTNYGDGENGSVNSPCFDFTGIAVPYLSMDIWYDIEGTWDGAILQSSTDGGSTWNRVGSLGDPANWYPDTSAAIVDNGYETHGDAWTGDGTSGTQGWVKAEHELVGLGNLSSVRLRMVFTSDGATTNEGIAFDNVQIYDLACAGLPNNSVASAPDSICSNVDFDLLASDLSDAMGITYQWEESVAGSGIWTAISGATDSSYTVSGGITSEMEYRFISSCSYSGLSDTSNVVTVKISHRNACYCDVAFLNTVLPITNVDFAGISNLTSATPNGTPALEDFTSQVGSVSQGSSHTITVEGNSDGNYTDEYQVYFDWNQDGDLDDANESYYIGSITNSTGTDNIQASTSISVPAGALVGNTRMRVVKNFSVAGSPCVVDQYGQAEDYTVNVTISVNIAQHDMSNSFVISPNPSNGIFRISAEGLENGKGSIQIRDIGGKILYSEDVDVTSGTLNTQLDVQEFAKGIYFMTFSNGMQNVSKKLVIQ